MRVMRAIAKEMMKLKWGDVDLKNKRILIRSDDKLKKGRVLPIHKNLIEVLKIRIGDKEDKVCPFKDRHSARKSVIKYGEKINLKIE